MSLKKTYIQQLYYNGVSYSQGTVVDVYSQFNIACMDIPYKRYPQPKEVATRNWPDRHGLDAFIPSGALPVKEYDIDVEFICYEEDEDLLRQDINGFIDLLYGKSKADSGDTVQSGRLAIYNEYVAMGRKDVMVKEIDPNIYFVTDVSDNDPEGTSHDQVAKFTVTFTVLDPVTEVTPTYSEGVVNGLSF